MLLLLTRIITKTTKLTLQLYETSVPFTVKRHLKDLFRLNSLMDGFRIDWYFLQCKQWIFLVELSDPYGHWNRWLETDFGEKTTKIESLGAQVL